MTTETDVNQRLAALYATLAKATKACPCSRPDDSCGPCDVLNGDGHASACDGGCQGTGEVAAFSEFRQDCGDCSGTGKTLVGGRSGGGHVNPVGTTTCLGCQGRRWQVRDGGTAAGLAGLTIREGQQVFIGLLMWIEDGVHNDPMPSETENDVKTLELVCQIRGLEVSSACAS